MSDDTTPPIPEQSADEAARRTPPPPAAAPPATATPVADVDDTGAGIALLLATIILVPLVSFFAVIVLRFLIEAVVALIAIAENTERTAQHTRR
jgi:hypothetical protein